MRSIISLDQYTSSDAKPDDLYRRYIELTHQDVSELLLKHALLDKSVCPACQSSDMTDAFRKCGMQYMECCECHSLFINPGPDDQTINAYYANSRAEKFWHENLSLASVGFREEKIIASRMQWLEGYASELAGDLHVMDIHPHQDGWIEVLAASESFTKKTLVHPLVKVSAGLEDQFLIIREPFVDVNLEDQVDIITLFEVVDRTSDLDALFNGISGNLRKGGLCLITSILASGFDIQTLWEHSDNMFPPDRLNALTVEGFEALFSRHGFEVVELSTPGGLDVDFVARAMQSNPDLALPRALSYMLDHRTDEVRDAFQQFLQSGLLSSFGRMVIRKL